MKSKIRFIAILTCGIVLLVSARPIMTYVMYLQENQKSKINVAPPDKIVGYDPSSGGAAGFGAPSTTSTSEDSPSETETERADDSK